LNSYNDDPDQQSIQIRIDADLQSMIPGYLANRYKDIADILEALKSYDYEKIRIAGHSMKGSGGGYGFDAITEFGAAFELDAKNMNSDNILSTVTCLKRYLDNLEVLYEEFS
jgi:HPt (histidine-containing phosphotransfer) domain-containing protein